MAAKPLIGINTDYRSTRKEHAALSFVAAGYFDGITASGGIPVILPPLADEDDVVRLLDLLDGVVMVGGADLDPRRDGYMAHPAVRPMDTRREDFDRCSTSPRGARCSSTSPRICPRPSRTRIRPTWPTGMPWSSSRAPRWSGCMATAKSA